MAEITGGMARKSVIFILNRHGRKDKAPQNVDRHPDDQYRKIQARQGWNSIPDRLQQRLRQLIGQQGSWMATVGSHPTQNKNKDERKPVNIQHPMYQAQHS